MTFANAAMIALACSCALFGVASVVYCQPSAPAQDASQVADYAAKLARCQAVGRAVNSYASYEACTVEAGLAGGDR